MSGRPTFFSAIRTAAQRTSRGVTLGVRGLVFDDEARVLLIEHTYVRGWHFPGGGIERAESAEIALAREMVEEAGVEVLGSPQLVSVHDNSRHFPGDLVLLFRVDRWSPTPATSRGEIARLGFFSPDALPADTTPATRRRIIEATGGQIPDLTW